MSEDDDDVITAGELLLRIIALEKDTNQNRDIYAGWLVSQMDLAASSLAGRVAKGRTATVSISKLDFLSPVRVGAELSFFGQVQQMGNSSVHIQIEVWTRDHNQTDSRKVTEGTFILVSIDEAGRIRSLPGQ
ncbi:MAG: acyl-CoA thioesterase [Hahellaceae bacterium]|jgi:acyl-CoA thioesterase YciA|nr:acyl-CoA thioesterase [Hahellaceae bacterium]